MILIGAALLSTGYPSWIGMLMIGLNGSLLVALEIQKDAVPASFDLASLVVGIAFLVEAN
jgi:hypothetical protein